MLPYLSLFGRLMPTYGVLGMAGLGFGLLAALLRCKRFGLSRDDCAYLYILGAVGALVGAKLLYLLPLLPRLAVELPLLWEEPGEFYARYLSGGMVFYGGFFGGVAAAWGAAKYLRLRLSDFFPVLVPALPLVHAVGRVGCFCAGCCYGRAAPPPLGHNDSLRTAGFVLSVLSVVLGGITLVACIACTAGLGILGASLY